MTKKSPQNICLLSEPANKIAKIFGTLKNNAYLCTYLCRSKFKTLTKIDNRSEHNE